MKKVFCIMIVLIVASIMSCFDSKEPYPGFADVFYESPYLGEGQHYLEQNFKVRTNTPIHLSIILENTKQDNKIHYKTAEFRQAFIEDSGQIIKVEDVIKDFEVKITNKKQEIAILINNFIKENETIYIFNHDPIYEIYFPTFKLTAKMNKINIYSPNVQLKTWKVKLVLGKGATGGL